MILNITEKEAELLDYILKEVSKKGTIRIDSLQSIGEGFLSKHSSVINHNYSFYIDTLVGDNLIKFDGWSEKTQTIEKIPGRTQSFLDSGGYTELFKKNKIDEKTHLSEPSYTTINANQVLYNEQSNNGSQYLSDNFKTSSLTQNTNNSNEKKPKTNWAVKTITLLIFPIVIMLVGFSLKKCDNADSTKSSTPTESNADQKTKEMKADDTNSIKQDNVLADSLSMK